MLCHTRSSISKFLIDRQASCWLASADRGLCGADRRHVAHITEDAPTCVGGHLRRVDQHENRGIDSEIARKFNSLPAYRGPAMSKPP